jgi:hypothetical protein
MLKSIMKIFKSVFSKKEKDSITKQANNQRAKYSSSHNSTRADDIQSEPIKKYQATNERKIINSWETQFDIGNKDEIDVIIGLDFGSSSTKCIVGVNDEKHLIDFGEDGLREQSYIMPTKFEIDENGNINFKRIGNSKAVFEDFKIELLKNSKKILSESFKIDAEMVTTIYLALIFRKLRMFFLREKYMEYQYNKLNWLINIGMPSKKYNDDNSKGTYKDITKNAWKISTLKKEVLNINDFLDNKNLELEEIHPENINIIAETIASINGYYQAENRKNGLHIIIDIGSRTLDFAGFIVDDKDYIKKETKDLYNEFVSDYELFGTYFLHEERVKILKGIGILNCNLDISQIISHLPEFKRYTNKNNNNSEHLLLYSFQNSILKYLEYLYIKLKTNCPNENEFDENHTMKIRTFILGGGSNVDFYKILINDFNKKEKNNLQFEELDTKEIPITDEVFISVKVYH